MHTTTGVYDRFAADPQFQARFRRAYRGRHDPADAAWWTSHPAEAGPTGARPPRESRAALLAAVYSREGSTDRGASAALARFDADLAADQRSLDAALVEAESGAPTVTDVAEPAGGDAGDARSRGDVVPRRRPMILGAVVILVVGALAGSAVGWFAGGEAQAAHVATASGARESGSASPSPTDPTFDPLSGFATKGEAGSQRFQNPEELAQPQEPVDRPDVPIPSSFSADSFRITDGYTDDRLTGKLKIYFARDTSGHTCVVVVTAAKSLNSDCIAPQYFPASGINLVWSDSSGSGYLLWLNDGTVSYGYSPPAG